MASYASLWTSASDKKFRQMSKSYSLQKRQLGLKVGGIQLEHERHVKQLRVEMREAGTLSRQYEAEKERRARHLLTTFIRVQHKRQAAEDWREAHLHRLSTLPPPSVTFDVQIGDKAAPWGGGRQNVEVNSMLSSQRKSSSGSVGSFQPSKAHSSTGSVFAIKSVSKSPFQRSRRHTYSWPRKLPPINRRYSNEHQTVRSGHWTKWQAALSRHQPLTYMFDEQSCMKATRDDGQQEVQKGQQGSEWTVACPESSIDQLCVDDFRANKHVLWTETFPFVYHCVGETVCPRYKVFLQYDEYTVYPHKLQKTKQKRSLMSAKSHTNISGRPSFKGLAQSLGAIQRLANSQQ